MALIKRQYIDNETVITAENMNDIQDAILELEDGLFTVDDVKSGEVITISDASKRSFRSFTIYGKTTQDGTPTPDNPVDLVSVGESGSITVNVTGENKSQSMTIATPNGLPGIPVDSGGNYTDANGQQWICDEIDFHNAVFVRRIGVIKSYAGEEVSGVYMSSTGELTEGATVLYARDNPIEAHLSEEELAAYAALHTSRNKAIVFSDAGAYMELEYVMDAKKYIDSLVASSTIHQATVE